MKVRWRGDTPEAAAARAELRRLALAGLSWSAIGRHFGISEGAAHAAFRSHAAPGDRAARQRAIDHAARRAAARARLAQARAVLAERRRQRRRDPFAGLGECFR